MIDIHSHILPSVDDGSEDLEQSIKLLEEVYNVGISKIIFTPHLKKGYYEETAINLQEKFNSFNNQIKERFPNLEIYLGQEILCDRDIYKKFLNKEILTLANSKAVLLEFPIEYSCDIAEYVYNFKAMGYIPIVAHVERYAYCFYDVKKLYEICANGGLLQINANTINGLDSKKVSNLSLKYIKKGLISFIASDVHYRRQSNMKDAYLLILKKFGKEVAENLFRNNANKYIFTK